MIELTADNIFVPDYRGRLTEGITYNKSNNSVLWLDIIVGEIHRVLLDNKFPHQVLKNEYKPLGESVGAIGLTKDDNKVVYGGKYGIGIADFENQTMEYIVKYEDNPRVRSNDGMITPWGDFVIGVMTDAGAGELKQEGKLYYINKDLEIKTWLQDCFIPNGLGFSPDGTKFYWTDTMTYCVWQFDYNHETKDISNRQPLIDFSKYFDAEDPGSPTPDGMCVCKNGEFYSTIYSKSTIVKFNTKGEVLDTIKLPAERITCCTIGGENSDELFITTCHEKEQDFDYKLNLDKKGDLGGYLFRMKLDLPVVMDGKYIWQGPLSVDH